MLVGYSRVSTIEQEAGLGAQLRDLNAIGCQEIFSERVSSVQRRGELEKALRFIRKDDILVVTKLDRLARSVPDLVRITASLEEKGASLKILAMGIDTSTPTGKLMLNLIGAISQFEREVMLERQREGITKANKEGRYKGRTPTARAKSDDVLRLLQQGKKPTEIAASLSIGRASVYRILKHSQI